MVSYPVLGVDEVGRDVCVKLGDSRSNHSRVMRRPHFVAHNDYDAYEAYLVIRLRENA